MPENLSSEQTAVRTVLSSEYLDYEYSMRIFPILVSITCNDDGDGNESVNKGTKTTVLHVHYTFWYISLPSLHD